MSKKSKFPELKQEIKTREAASREIRKSIQGTSGMERHQHWLDKRCCTASLEESLVTRWSPSTCRATSIGQSIELSLSWRPNTTSRSLERRSKLG